MRIEKLGQENYYVIEKTSSFLNNVHAHTLANSFQLFCLCNGDMSYKLENLNLFCLNFGFLSIVYHLRSKRSLFSISLSKTFQSLSEN